MKQWQGLLLALAALLVGAGFCASAQQAPAYGDKHVPLYDGKPLFAPMPAAGIGAPIPAVATVHQVLHERGHSLSYRAVSSEFLFRDEKGVPEATLFSTAFVLEGAARSQRPVTFVYDGGPGGSAMALRQGIAPHLIVPDAASPGQFKARGNPDSILDTTDLVFIDPVGTGFSRVLAPGAAKQFWGDVEDGRATARFIREWLKRNGRTQSPLFLLGESYGGVRTAFTAHELDAQGVALRGLILVSPATGLRGNGIGDERGAGIPSMAAVAHAYGRGAYAKLPVAEVYEKARQFVEGPYRRALAQGAALPPEQKRRIAEQLAALIGTSTEYVLSKNLAVTPRNFLPILLADRHETVGILDGRQHEPNATAVGVGPPRIIGSEAMYHAMFATDLGYRPAGFYSQFSMEVNQRWHHQESSPFDSVPAMIADVAQRQPRLRVLLLSGYYDLTCPMLGQVESFEAARFSIHALVMKKFDSGHTLLTDETNRPRAAAAIRRFISDRQPGSVEDQARD